MTKKRINISAGDHKADWNKRGKHGQVQQKKDLEAHRLALKLYRERNRKSSQPG